MLDIKELVILGKEEFLSLPETIEKKKRDGRSLKSVRQLTDDQLDQYLYDSYTKDMVEMIMQVERANMGDPRAQRIVGVAILNGLLVGVNVDKERGIEYLEMAAEQNDLAAAFSLFRFYEKDDPEKSKFYRDLYFGRTKDGAER